MRFAVCDDEAELRRDISDKIAALCPGASVTEFSSGGGLLADTGGFDIIFLDIGMDGPDGMQTARELRKNGCRAAIIFVTAFGDRVFDAFDVGAFNFLVKPVSAQKFAEVLQKAIDSRDTPPPTESHDRYIAIKTGGLNTKLALSEIMYAEVFDRILILHTTGGKVEYRGRLRNAPTTRSSAPTARTSSICAISKNTRRARSQWRTATASCSRNSGTASLSGRICDI